MNLEPVSVESSRLGPSRPNFTGELTQKTVFGNDSRRGREQYASEAQLKQIVIEIALEKWPNSN